MLLAPAQGSLDSEEMFLGGNQGCFGGVRIRARSSVSLEPCESRDLVQGDSDRLRQPGDRGKLRIDPTTGFDLRNLSRGHADAPREGVLRKPRTFTSRLEGFPYVLHQGER